MPTRKSLLDPRRRCESRTRELATAEDPLLEQVRQRSLGDLLGHEPEHLEVGVRVLRPLPRLEPQRVAKRDGEMLAWVGFVRLTEEVALCDVAVVDRVEESAAMGEEMAYR